MAQTEFNGIGFGVSNTLSNIEGGFGFGAILGTNLIIDAQTVIFTPLLQNTRYYLNYTDSGGVAQSKEILHDVATPYQDSLPSGVPITFYLPATNLYAEYSATFSIQPNTQPVYRPRISFVEAYARVTQIYFL